MKLVISQYLASLKEREELDAVLPDLLSQLGLNVLSRPGRGTRQDGVDVAAVGRLDGQTEESVHLYSIKAGDLGRQDWSSTPQSLRPSLEEILDVYIPTRIPAEHRGKPIVIYLCLGGQVREEVQSNVNGFKDRHKSDQISFETWNGDKLAALIEESFLREELMGKDTRDDLRKAIALIDEPEASFGYFKNLVGRLQGSIDGSEKSQLRALRQIAICLWIQFSWARDARNLESAYLAAELGLLVGWQISKEEIGKGSKHASEIGTTLDSIFSAYHNICSSFFKEKVKPFVGKTHALSSAVSLSSHLDINLRLFDLLGRVALYGCWLHFHSRNEEEPPEAVADELSEIAQCIRMLVSNNPALFMPIKDDGVIELTLAIIFLLTVGGSADFVDGWLHEMLHRAVFAMQTKEKYPCRWRAYEDLVHHPKKTEDYFEESTAGSVLYPMIALLSALIGATRNFDQVREIQEKLLPHSNFQLWFPAEDSESHFYTGSDDHGLALSDLKVENSTEQFVEEVFRECEQSKSFNELSAIKWGLYPLILVACRHYRLPVPIQFLTGLRPVIEDDCEEPQQVSEAVNT